ncbi:MAG: thioesterase [Acidimicrobiia bacterium]|nr:thioesterase [Acidimicrobiia bacterium]MBT8218139.1 thioesterase [Acidimicrobiia bacterium]NNF10878.1 thioesterase [Acidimicrobiia bacterium]NNL70072.1 thioesterase [Acidimicrobiia bacterium]
MQPGLTAEIALVVGDADTAIAFGSGDVPVLATPRLIALCEEATVAAIAGQLPDGTTTVGTRVEADHTRASFAGDSVTARATLVDADGRRLQFTVTVGDREGTPVAVARIWRVVVERDRFLSR